MNARPLAVSLQAAGDLVSLTKPRLSSLVLCTTAGGMYLSRGDLSAPKAFATLLATAGAVGAANALNCYLERESDRLMRRTQSRPLPSGRMEPSVALWFGISLAAVSLPALAIAANWLTAVLGLGALLSYVFAYTPLKNRTWLSVLVGAVPGALPPLMGSTAVEGRVGPVGAVLFAILVLWQIPHFIAIALFRKQEYLAAGMRSLPIERGDELARVNLLAYVLALVPVTLWLYPMGAAGGFYLTCASLLGAGFIGLSLKGFLRQLGAAWARRVFAYSIVYLAALFAALWIDVGF